jgi:hypothetical protein
VSRNASKPDSASLRKVKAASLPEMVKPATGDEITGAVHGRAFRGSWGQRAGKDSLRKLGDPAVRERQRNQRSAGIHNRDNGVGRESDRPIVCAEQRVVQEG